MKQRQINISGKVDKNGKLNMFMGELNEFLSQWKNSKLIVQFKVYQPGTSEAIRGYYFNKVVPDFRRAMWESGERLTEEQTEKQIRELCPIMWHELAEEKTGKYTAELREIADLDNQEMVNYIEHLKDIAAIEYNFFIDDPETLMK